RRTAALRWAARGGAPSRRRTAAAAPRRLQTTLRVGVPSRNPKPETRNLAASSPALLRLVRLDAGTRLRDVEPRRQRVVVKIGPRDPAHVLRRDRADE